MEQTHRCLQNDCPEPALSEKRRKPAFLGTAVQRDLGSEQDALTLDTAWSHSRLLSKWPCMPLLCVKLPHLLQLTSDEGEQQLPDLQTATCWHLG